MQQTAGIDAAADDCVPLLHTARQALTGKRHRIEARVSLCNHAIDWHFFARLDQDNRTNADIIRPDFFRSAVCLHEVCIIWSDIHEVGNIAAAAPDGIGLEPFADLIKQHDGDALSIISVLIDSQSHGTNGCDSHEQAFVKGLTAPNALARFDEDIIADNQIRHEICEKTRRARKRQICQQHHE